MGDRTQISQSGWGVRLYGLEEYKREITSAELLDLLANPQVIVPGTPGRITCPQSVHLIYKAGSIPYTIADAGDTLDINIAAIAGTTIDQFALTTGYLDQAVDMYIEMFYAIFSPRTLATAIAADLLLGVGNTTGAAHNPTLGNGTLIVKTHFYLVEP